MIRLLWYCLEDQDFHAENQSNVEYSVQLIQKVDFIAKVCLFSE